MMLAPSDMPYEPVAPALGGHDLHGEPRKVSDAGAGAAALFQALGDLCFVEPVPASRHGDSLQPQLPGDTLSGFTQGKILLSVGELFCHLSQREAA